MRSSTSASSRGSGPLKRAERSGTRGSSPWRPLADVEDRELLAVLDAAHRPMRTRVEGTRPLRHVYRRAGRASPLRHGDPLAPAGRRRARSRTGGPGCQCAAETSPQEPRPRRREEVCGCDLRCSTTRCAPFLPRRVALFHQDMDGGVDLPFAFEDTGSYGRPTLYEYRPLVRGFIEARAERSSSATTCAPRSPTSSASRRRGSSPAPTKAFRRTRRGRLPQRARAAARVNRGELRRLRLGRRRLRPRVDTSSRDPSSATATPTARSRASSASFADHDRAWRRHPVFRRRRGGRAVGDVAGARPAAARLRPWRKARPARVLELEPGAGAGRRRGAGRPRASSPTPSRCAPPLVRRLRVAAGPVLFERLTGAVRIMSVLPIAATAPPASRRGPRSVPGATVAVQLRPRSRARTTTRSSARRLTGGSSRCSRPARFAASSSSRARQRPGRRRRTGGRLDARRRPARRHPGGPGRPRRALPRSRPRS